MCLPAECVVWETVEIPRVDFSNAIGDILVQTKGKFRLAKIVDRTAEEYRITWVDDPPIEDLGTEDCSNGLLDDGVPSTESQDDSEDEKTDTLSISSGTCSSDSWSSEFYVEPRGRRTTKLLISEIQKLEDAEKYNIYPCLVYMEEEEPFPYLFPDVMSHVLSFFSIDEICRLFCVNTLFQKSICKNAIKRLRYVRNCATPRFAVGRISHSAYDHDENERMAVVMKHCRNLRKFKTQGDSIDVILKIVERNPNISHVSILKSQYAGLMTKRLPHLVSISLHESPDVGKSLTQLDSCELSTIHRLTISDKFVGRQSLTELLRNCVNLRSLILLGTQTVPEIDFSRLKHLNEVHLYGTVSDELLIELGHHSNLEILHISRINGLSDTSKILKILIENQRNLTDLKLSLYDRMLENDLITHLSQCLPDLTRLTIEDPYVHFGEDLKSIHKIHDLYRLKIDNLQSDETRYLFEYPLPNLHSLTLKTCELNGCHVIANQAPNLVYIRLNCCSRLTDDDVLAITDLKSLKYLHIISNNTGRSRGDLSDKSVEYVAQMDLYELTLIQYEPAFSGESLKYLVLPNYLPNLRKLKIYYGMLRMTELPVFSPMQFAFERDEYFKNELKKLFRFKPNCLVNITNPERGLGIV